MSSRAATGEAAKTLVWHRLDAAGLRLRHVNFRTRRGEIDLVIEAPDGQISWKSATVRGAITAVASPVSTPRKRQRLIHAARAYLHCHRLEQRPARFDVVAVEGHDRMQ